MPDLTISNTSPFFYLHRLKHLDLLRQLYQRIVVPEAVVAELHAGKVQGEDVPALSRFDWIEIRPVRTPEALKLIADLGAGETEVLALTLERPGSLAIIDDNLARRIAKLQQLRITGTAKVVLKAKQRGHIPTVRPLLDELTNLGFRLSNAVRANILKLATE